MSKQFPAEYREEYCEQIIETMSTGFSATAFAGKIKVSHSTLRKWAREHPEFDNAMEVGKACRVKALEKDLLEAIDNATVVSRLFMLKACAAHEYPPQLPASRGNGDDSPTRVTVVLSGGPPELNGEFAQLEPTPSFDGTDAKDITPSAH